MTVTNTENINNDLSANDNLSIHSNNRESIKDESLKNLLRGSQTAQLSGRPWQKPDNLVHQNGFSRAMELAKKDKRFKVNLSEENEFKHQIKQN